MRLCEFQLEARPGLALGGECGQPVLLDSRFCYWQNKIRNGVPIAETNGHRSLIEALEDWRSAEDLLEARAAKDALEYERQRRGIRALLDIGEEAL